jgi:hypothetical protein
VSIEARLDCVTTCPGSRLLPDVEIHTGARPRGVCPCCRGEYQLATPGVLRVHQGLPKRDDGGCPYRCPPHCDFDCYFPERNVELSTVGTEIGGE